MSASTLSSGTELDIGEFDYDLPRRLIAQHPTPERGLSRLLTVRQNCQSFDELRFSQLGTLLQRGDLLICNDSKVIPARLQARKPTGGRVEIFVERIVDDLHLEAQLGARRSIKVSDSIIVGGQYQLTVVDRKRDLFVLRLQPGVSLKSVITTFGSVPLPPYIKRPLEPEDRDRYQTVYARHDGSVAAPTAGLHFSDDQLQQLANAGIDIQYVTLHVGSGTFAPIRDGDIHQHQLHSERCELTASVCAAVKRAKCRGGRVIAVGTTAVRVLETAGRSGGLEPFKGETELFIKPGFEFKVADALVTNFHLPRSTLLMLVCAFGGCHRVLAAYRYAVEHQFRFYSYGDAMFVERRVDMSKS